MRQNINTINKKANKVNNLLNKETSIGQKEILDKRVQSVQQKKLAGLISNYVKSANRSTNILQSKSATVQMLVDAGDYQNTYKNDAHHMPSARAVSAIIGANQEKKTMMDPTGFEFNAGDYSSLAVNDIYKGAPAVWMPHTDHVATRTFGGKSTGALNNDKSIIEDNNAEDAFDEIQEKDFQDYDGIMEGSINKVANYNGLVASASSATKRNITDAIKEGVDVSRSSSGVSVAINLVQSAAQAILTYCNTHRKYIKPFVRSHSGIEISSDTIKRAADPTSVGWVQQDTATAIRKTYENLP